ncbi:MAG: hypothetical protein K2Q13_04005 [Nitrosomonas sp.]|uniref:hypothetical protein n=1 Tax=Nitrosomonas sp. TaxID=42353 RepID=UPI0025F26AA2|nr:hypothetical protein [Nitrosomonas sp.]MBY0474211.1 hypothetical protein [Nitrosomonas sp.]
MELVRLEITGTVITARYGALSPGDKLNTDLEFARHLVDECKAARFIDDKTSASVPDKKKTKGRRNEQE